MSQKRKTYLYVACLVLSCGLAIWFMVQTGLFLMNTAAQYQSFSEAVKQLLSFAMTAFVPAAILCASVVLAGVGIKVSADARQKKIARGIFAAEMVLLGIYALLVLSMFVVFPEEWV